jgi:hypothetical protein
MLRPRGYLRSIPKSVEELTILEGNEDILRSGRDVGNTNY